MKPVEQNHYEFLGVEPEASREEIQRAVQKLRELFGPGSLALYSLVDQEEHKALLDRLEEAAVVLADERARAAYDERHGLGRKPAPAPAEPRPGPAEQLVMPEIVAAVDGAPAWPGAEEGGAPPPDPAREAEASRAPAAAASATSAPVAPSPAAATPAVGTPAAASPAAPAPVVSNPASSTPAESSAAGSAPAAGTPASAPAATTPAASATVTSIPAESRGAATPPARSGAAASSAAASRAPSTPATSSPAASTPAVGTPAASAPAASASVVSNPASSTPASPVAGEGGGDEDLEVSIDVDLGDLDEPPTAPAVAVPGEAGGAPGVFPEPGPETEYTGALLRQLREARGVSLQDLAARTRISVGHLENLEAEAFRQLPERVYLRGFLTAYARELKLDAARLSETYLARWAAHRRH